MCAIARDVQEVPYSHPSLTEQYRGCNLGSRVMCFGGIKSLESGVWNLESVCVGVCVGVCVCV